MVNAWHKHCVRSKELVFLIEMPFPQICPKNLKAKLFSPKYSEELWVTGLFWYFQINNKTINFWTRFRMLIVQLWIIISANTRITYVGLVIFGHSGREYWLYSYNGIACLVVLKLNCYYSLKKLSFTSFGNLAEVENENSKNPLHTILYFFFTDVSLNVKHFYWTEKLTSVVVVLYIARVSKKISHWI